MRAPLTAVCYLAPGLPRAFFEALVKHLEPGLGRSVRVVFDERSSGPMLGHLASLALLDEGEIDAAAIDSNVLALARPDLGGLRVIESWGPYPIQPIVLRRELAGELLERLTASLLELGSPGSLVPAFEHARLERLVPIEPGIYDEEREVLKGLGRL